MAAPTVADLSALLGRVLPAGQGEAVLRIVTMAVRAYVRGAANWVPNDEEASVILSAAARLASNPSQLQRAEAVGPQSASWHSGFDGFTVGEQMTLSRYRIQAV